MWDADIFARREVGTSATTQGAALPEPTAARPIRCTRAVPRIRGKRAVPAFAEPSAWHDQRAHTMCARATPGAVLLVIPAMSRAGRPVVRSAVSKPERRLPGHGTAP